MHVVRNATRAVLFAVSSILVAFSVLNQAVTSQALASQTKSSSDSNKPAVKVHAHELYGKLPLSFEDNQGQTDKEVQFLSRGPGYTLFLKPTEAVLALRKGEGKNQSPLADSTSKEQSSGTEAISSAVLRMQLVGGKSKPQPETLEELPGKVNYFIGNDPKKWRTNIPTYSKVKYRDVYPGIDLIYYGNQRQLEFDFIVTPRADPNKIRLNVDGSDGIEVDSHGDLLLHVDDEELIRLPKPIIYQTVNGMRHEVYGGYVLKGSNHVSFQVGAYDRKRPLVIDPGLVYSTYLGGSGDEIGRSIAVDAAGNAYVTGETTSVDFPTSAGAFQGTFGGGQDAFVTKLNATGSAVMYSTYLGGNNFDRGWEIVVDGTGNAYVAGEAGSSNFPVTAGAFQTTFGGNSDSFVTKLDPTGSVLVYSTYVGGSGFDQGLGLAIDSAGNAYVTGNTGSSGFPTTTGAFQTSSGGGTDVFVSKLDPTGSALVYSTYLGGTGSDIGYGIAVDSGGNAYVTGSTTGNFPTTAGVFQPGFAGTGDAFVTKLNSAGSALVYSTYLGGSNQDQGLGIAVDTTGNAYVTGETSSANFPTTAGALQTVFGGGFEDVFVTKLNASGTGLIYSTYLGGNGDREIGWQIALDIAGNAYVAGETTSANFPVTGGAFQTTFGGGVDAFVSKLDATGSGLLYSTYFGGSSADAATGIAIDDNGDAYITGVTIGANFPVTTGAFQTTFGGGVFDVFVAKIAPAGTPAMLTLSPAGATNPVNSQHCVTATVKDAVGNPVPGVTVRFTVTGSVNTTGSATTDASGEATFCYTGPTSPGADAITAYADTDNSNTQDVGEPSGAATKTWVPGAPATLTLAPPVATNPVNTQHCVTATVKDALANPTPGIVVRFSVTGSVTTSGSATTNASGQATFCYTGPQLIGGDAIAAYADTNNNNTQNAGEPGGAAAKTWIAGTPATLVLAPATASNAVNTQHCVTATVKDAFTNPTPSITVRFSVSGSVTTSGSATTNASGQATFCYNGPSLPGADTITAYADTNNNNTQNAGEPSGAAAKTWVLPVTTAGCTVTNGGQFIANNGDKATFGGNANSSGPKGNEEYSDQGPTAPMKVNSISVQAVVCSTNKMQASIYGQATVNGSTIVNYLIQVKDLGELGRQDTYRIILSNGYDSGEHTLEGGKIQIH